MEFSCAQRRGNEQHGPDRMFLKERHIVLIEPGNEFKSGTADRRRQEKQTLVSLLRLHKEAPENKGGGPCRCHFLFSARQKLVNDLDSNLNVADFLFKVTLELTLSLRICRQQMKILAARFWNYAVPPLGHSEARSW
jgi:hypothetical protein